ncbi:MAG: DNA polymerase III subunit delta [Hyphomicrobiaceae bacterium]
MVAVKAQQAESFARAPDKSVVAVLVHGPDSGLVSERARSVATALAARGGDDSEIIRIEEPDLDGDPDRLVVELQTIPMFGGAKVVRTTAGRKINAALFKSLFADGAPAAGLVCEAGNLKASDALRKLFEGTAWAAAVPCYADGDGDLGGLVRDMMKSAGLRIDREAIEILVARLGADRALSRGEIEKLILYCTGKDAVTIEDIEAIVGDATDTGLEYIAIAAASGEPQQVVAEFDRAVTAGENPQAIILVALRYFQRLHRVRSAVDAGKSIDEALRSLRPPLHFKLRDAVTAQCRLWPSASLAEALQRINETARQARLNSAMDAVLAERLLFNLAAHIAQRKRR